MLLNITLFTLFKNFIRMKFLQNSLYGVIMYAVVNIFSRTQLNLNLRIKINTVEAELHCLAVK